MNPRQLFMQDPRSGHIRFTRAGYDIRAIRTMAQFEAAVDASFANEMCALADTTKGHDPKLDAALDGLPGWE